MLTTSLVSSQSAQLSSQKTTILTTPTMTRFFNLTFADNHNFSVGAGNWTTAEGGGWALNATQGSIDSGGNGAIVDYSKTFKDFIMTIDYYATHTTGTTGVFTSYFHATNLTGFASTWTTYSLSLGAHNQTSPFRGVSLEHNLEGTLSTDWYYNSSLYNASWDWPTLTGTHASLGVYNNTWMRETIGMVGNNIFATWNKLDGSDVNAWRMSVKQSKYPATALSGFMMMRSETATNVRIRQILYDYPAFPISMKAGESASIHFAANYTVPVFSGTPALGTFQNGYWNFSTSDSNIGLFNQTFTMTNGTHAIDKHISVSIFPDMELRGAFYASNPVVPSTATGMDVKDPCVIYDSSDQYFKMWYSVADNIPTLVLTTHYLRSRDGVTWENNGWADPLSSPGDPLEKVSVVKVGTTYHLVIGALNRSGIYHYQSSDGITWVIQNSGNPIITGTKPWESGAVAAPNVVYRNGIYYIIYGSGISPDPTVGIYEQRAGSMAYGTSLNSLTKSPIPLKFWENDANGNYSMMMGAPRPFRYGNSWLAISGGFDPREIGSACQATLYLSNDLLNWTVYPGSPAFPRGAQSWFNSMTYTGWIASDESGSLGFWFNGVTAQEQIGMAIYLPQGSTTWADHFVILGSDRTFTLYELYTPQISALINLIFLMFAVGIVVGVIAEGTNSLRNQKMRTTEQMVRSLLNMVIYIVIGIASLGVLYSIVV
jgi:hypothetical protein